jgi:hypothetical protein
MGEANLSSRSSCIARESPFGVRPRCAQDGVSMVDWMREWPGTGARGSGNRGLVAAARGGEEMEKDGTRRKGGWRGTMENLQLFFTGVSVVLVR